MFLARAISNSLRGEILGNRCPHPRPLIFDKQMILNNFQTMQQIRTWKEQPLSRELIFEIHRMIADQTLDKPDAAGRLRREDELVIVENASSRCNV